MKVLLVSDLELTNAPEYLRNALQDIPFPRNRAGHILNEIDLHTSCINITLAEKWCTDNSLALPDYIDRQLSDELCSLLVQPDPDSPLSERKVWVRDEDGMHVGFRITDIDESIPWTICVNMNGGVLCEDVLYLSSTENCRCRDVNMNYWDSPESAF